MTSLNLDENKATFQIRGFTPGSFHINDFVVHHSIIITAHELIQPWAPDTINSLTPELLLPPLKVTPEILLRGTGQDFHFVPLECYGHLFNQGISVEIMSTPAACRTFSILTAEERRVAAALFVR